MTLEKHLTYCEVHNLPMFAPISGICFSCRRKVEDTDKEHMTGCPHCHRSWCD